MRALIFIKRTFIISTLALALTLNLFVLSSPVEAGEFEGLIYVSMMRGFDAPPTDLKYFVKPNKLRIETYINQFSKISEIKIFDFDAGKMFTIMPDEKQYFETELTKKSGLADEPNGAAEQVDLFKPEKTDETEIFHGYTCEQWIIKEGDELEIEMWVAKGFSPVEGIGGKVPIEGGNVTPFKTITRFDGEEVSRIEITKITDRKIDDDKFQAPKGYKKISLGE